MFPKSLALRNFSSVEAIEVNPGEACGIIVDQASLRYEAIFSPFHGSDALFVSYHGAVNRDKYDMPVFARWNWENIFQANVLSFSDPTLRLSPTLTLGWYIGKSDCDATDVIVDIVRRVALVCGIPEKRIVFWSSSAGGFAGMIAASRMDAARALAVNPQTDLSRYSPHLTSAFLPIFGSYERIEEACAAFPLRFSAIEAARSAFSAGRDLKIIVAQNTQDQFHLQGHYRPMVSAFDGIDAGGISRNGRLMTILFDSDSGHGNEPMDVTKIFVEKARQYFLA